MWCVTLLPLQPNSSFMLPGIEQTYVGVSDETVGVAWGLGPGVGALRRWSLGPCGVRGKPTPPGYPNGHCTQVEGSNLRGELSSGAHIEVRFDADRGVLSFRVNGGGPEKQWQEVLRGFPKGAAIRPWARVLSSAGVVIRPRF